MTERAAPGAWWRGLLTTTRGRIALAASLVVVVGGALALVVLPAHSSKEQGEGRPVPDEDLPYLVSAARSCPALTPPRLAAQVMAATAFGTDGTDRGLSGMDDAAWAKWRPSATADRADPEAGIEALAHRTCDMVGELRVAKIGGDPWATALATDPAGVQPVIAAKGIPDSDRPYVDKVVAYAHWYADQPQFSVAASTSASPDASAAAVPFDPGARYQIRNVWTGAVLDLPGPAVKPADGTRIHLWNNKNQKDQFWRIVPAPDAKYVLIVNDFTGQALAIENASTANQAKVIVAKRDDAAMTQQWTLTDAGNGKVSITNRLSGKVMELLGNDLGPPLADGTWNGYLVEQADRQPTKNQDQFWLLVK